MTDLGATERLGRESDARRTAGATRAAQPTRRLRGTDGNFVILEEATYVGPPEEVVVPIWSVGGYSPDVVDRLMLEHAGVLGRRAPAVLRRSHK